MAVPRHRQSNSGFAVGRISTAFGESGAHLHKMSPLFSAEADTPASTPSIEEIEEIEEIEDEPQGEVEGDQPLGEPNGEAQVEGDQPPDEQQPNGEAQVEVINLNDED